MTQSSNTIQPVWLGIEGGGTRTVALLADEQGRCVRRIEAGPANLKLLTDAQLWRICAASLRIAAAFGLAFWLLGGEDWRRIRAAPGSAGSALPGDARRIPHWRRQAPPAPSVPI